jgi:hypothetical protein
MSRIKVNEKAIRVAARKLNRLRLTDVSGDRSNPVMTVKSVLQGGLGGHYDDMRLSCIFSNSA